MIIDAIFFLVVLFGFYYGFSRGIIRTVLYTVSLLFGFVIAVRFAPAATQFLTTVFNYESPMMYLLGFILCLGVTIMAIQMLAKGMESVLQSANINVINKFFGGVVMAGIFLFFYSILVWFANKSHLIEDQTKQESATYSLLENYPQEVKQIWNNIQPSLADFWEDSVEFIDKMEEKSIQRSESETEIRDLEEEPVD